LSNFWVQKFALLLEISFYLLFDTMTNVNQFSLYKSQNV